MAECSLAGSGLISGVSSKSIQPSTHASLGFLMRDNASFLNGPLATCNTFRDQRLPYRVVVALLPEHCPTTDAKQDKNVAAPDDSPPGIIEIPIFRVVDEGPDEKRRRDNPV